jgi:hypothetical protein
LSEISNILNNPILNNNCSNNIEVITALAFGNKATWIGGDIGGATEWNIAANWDPAVVPDDALTDVFIPAGATNQPTIIAANQPHQPGT